MFKLLNKKKNNKGFTLVELVIVIAILAILVGLLAPQYTKYVEKSRKTADASNMDEIVKVIKVYAADPANELPAGIYAVTMECAANGKTDVTVTGLKEGATTQIDELKAEIGKSIPKWTTTVTKSKKWGTDGAPANITATVTVGPDGGTSVEYGPDAFAKYMAGNESTATGAGAGTGTQETGT